jgi:uridine kinase
MGKHKSLEQIIELLQEVHKSRVLIAIDGHSAAGKTTLARAIQYAFPKTKIIHADDFYRVMNETERQILDAEKGYQLYYDWQRLESQVLLPLSKNLQSCYQKYDWHHNQLSDWITVPSEGIIIIEGCYSSRPELKDYYDITILVDTDTQKRMERQMIRADASQEWIERWDAAERFYMEKYQPLSYVDYLVKDSS